ncbi:MAG TPA: hypothetical protein VMC83_14710 [Streptosporangiaceae bacterium]|nr:hypothetical protein [Streptosporangiaceae bacterium]
MADSQSEAGGDEATQLFPGQDAVIVTRLAESPGEDSQPATEVVPPQPPTEVVPPRSPTEIAAHQVPVQVAPQHPPTEVAADSPLAPAAPAPEPTVTAPPGQAAGPAQQAAAPAPPARPARPAPLPAAAGAMPPSPAAGIVRYGPGVPVDLPVSQGGRTAEHVWSGGPPPAPPRRPARLRRLGGSALTAVLLIASGVILFLRFYHPPFQVTGAAISQHTAAGCRVDVTGRIATNGAAGTVSYRWLFTPGQQQATTLRQSVASGQHAVDVTVAVEGSGSGTATQTAVLQVLSPGRRTASAHVTLSC